MTPLRNRLVRSAIATLALTSLAACAHGRGAAVAPVGASTPAPTTVVIVVRHAEKAPLPADDPVLSDIGIARAQALDGSLRSTAITDVVVSHLQRTRLTAAPLIARTGAAMHVVPIGPAGVSAHVRALADTVRAIARGAGRGVLVVGHSNTVNLIVQALGGSATPSLCDSQYSQLFTLRVGDGPTTAARSTYGAADPVDASCAAMRASP
ncbi:MAG: histidine phosphatase family protein [Gemmatimonadaceae bacterium]|nr:histidine phosphatase family protein [Gemmatimonadaceae bacterium]